MKQFKFPLETLLKVQDQKLKIFKKELCELENSKKQTSLLILEAKKEMAMIKQSLSLKKHDFQYLKRLEDDLKSLQKNFEEIKRKEKNKKKEATTSIQMRKIVAKMKERRYSIWYEKTNDTEEL